MTQEKIVEEVDIFVELFFEKYFDIIEKNFDFIDSHNLYVSKKNYLFTLEFLFQIIRSFRRFDNQFLSTTFGRLYRDTQNLQTIYLQLQSDSKKDKEIFLKQFLPKHKLFQEMKKSIEILEDMVRLDSYEKETKAILNTQYKEMYTIYYSEFQKSFHRLNGELLSDIKEILNSKVFYLEKFLWKETSNSQSIINKLNSIKIGTKVDERNYLLLGARIDFITENNYKYLQKCLRTYR